MTKLAELLPAPFVAPDYGGGALSDLPPTVGALLGVDAPWRSQPLNLPAAGEGVKQVVLLLVDGLGYLHLRALLEKEDAGLKELLTRYGGLPGGELPPPITSVSPSTTAAATSALQADGSSPAALGLLGYTQRLPSLGVTANMILFTPAFQRGARLGSLAAWGVTPESLLVTPTIYQLLGAGGVRGRAYAPATISRNPLSRMQFQGAEVCGYVDWVDMLTQIAAGLEASAAARERSFSYAYLPDFDSLMHRDGVESPSVPNLFRAFVPQLARTLDGLSPAAREGTLFLVTADHGHVSTPAAERRLTSEFPALAELSATREAGEPRHVYLYARNGAADELFAATREGLSDSFLAVRGAEALAAGLYGDPTHLHPEAERRIGDVVLLAKGGATLWPADEVRPLKGMHGSLEPAEMLVPLLALRADA